MQGVTGPRLFANCFIAAQNGAAGFGQLGTTSSTGSHGEAAKRPASLGIGSSSGFATKVCQDTSEEVDEGSLPCTPELMSVGDPEATAHGESLDSDTRQLVNQTLQDFTGRSRLRWRQSKALPTMKRVVGELVEKHHYVYKGLIKKLSLNDKGDDVSFVRSVAQSLFADGITNWGRIVSLMAFGAVVCKHLDENHRGDCVDLVGQEISSYLLSERREWLVKNNSWDGFVEFFRVTHPETTMMKSLVAFAGVAGIGATLALLIR